MRALILPLLLLAACDRTEPRSSTAEGTTPASFPSVLYWRGEGCDRLCQRPNEKRVGLITYAANGNANCSMRGSLSQTGFLTPDGDERCMVRLQSRGDTIKLTEVGAACAYYCGPGASLENKAFRRMAGPEPANDFGGDPLC